MPTYAEYARRSEVRERRRKQDVRDAERHRGFDLAAQDSRMKYERFHFAVVGEGSQSANENYRRGYDAVNWSR